MSSGDEVPSGQLRTLQIIALALIEAPGMLGGIAYLIEKNSLGLAVMGLGVGLMLARFPTEGNVRQWLEAKKEELERLRQERSSAPSGMP
jgi:hypothetical protein